jgi:hypothetical protein
MYIESKAEGLSGAARIGRVSFSKTGRTIYYDGKTVRSLKGAGFKATTATSRPARSTGFPDRRETAPTVSMANACLSTSTMTCGWSTGLRPAASRNASTTQTPIDSAAGRSPPLCLNRGADGRGIGSSAV